MKTVAGAYDLTGLGSIEELRRVLEISVLDTLGLESSVARSRTLIAAVGVGAKLLEVGEIEIRLATVEAALEDPGTRPERREWDHEGPRWRSRDG